MFAEKNLHISGPVQFKPTLSKGHLYMDIYTYTHTHVHNMDYAIVNYCHSDYNIRTILWWTFLKQKQSETLPLGM